MEHNYNFTDKCPTVFDYEVYLKGIGNSNFIMDFELHLNACELCNQSVQGYQAARLTNISETMQSTSKTFKIKTHSTNKVQFRIIKYAASIILLIGLSAIFFSQHNKFKNKQDENNFDYSLLIENPSARSKTLMKKNQDHFIYIGTCDKIAYNDQFLSSQELIDNLKSQKNINLITIEVATGNYECVSEIINSIKHENVAPIVTISTLKDIKKLTPWGGGLGG